MTTSRAGADADVTNALTVDLEEWFHICGAGGELAPDRWDSLPSRVERNTLDLLELLERCGVRATFFVLGWVAERYPALVKAVLEGGHEIGAHGFAHLRAYQLTPAAFKRDLDRNLDALRAAGADRVVGFRAPEWSINDRSLWALDILAQWGFRFDSSMTPLRIIGNPAYPQVIHTRATRHGAITEVPPFVGRWVGQNVPLGGGWGLRMSRPSSVIRAIERRNSAGQPATLFVHPWELDEDPPRARVTPTQRFVHYVGLSGFRAKFAELLSRVKLAPVGEVLWPAGRC